MQIGFHVVLYLFIFNLVCGLMYAVAVPGTEFSNVLAGTGNVTETQERVDPSKMLNETKPTSTGFFSWIEPIWRGLSLIWNAVRYTIFGFPTMLQGIGYQIQDPTAKAALVNIGNVMFAVLSLIGILWLFELFTGRKVED